MELQAGAARARWDAARGGRLVSLRPFGDDRELVTGLTGLDAPPEICDGCFPMAPYAGRVRSGQFTFAGRRVQLPVALDGHAIHGLVHDRAWAVTGPSSMACHLDDRWPFGGHALLDVRLTPRSLEMRLTYRAADAATPATIGFHPWFPRTLTGAPVRIDLSATARFERDAVGVPTGRLVRVGVGPWDDCFADPEWPVVLTWPAECRLSVFADTACVVVFDEHPDAVCVEPQTGPPDAVNIGIPGTLAPREEISTTMTWEWEDLRR